MLLTRKGCEVGFPWNCLPALFGGLATNYFALNPKSDVQWYLANDVQELKSQFPPLSGQWAEISSPYQMHTLNS